MFSSFYFATYLILLGTVNEALIHEHFTSELNWCIAVATAV